MPRIIATDAQNVKVIAASMGKHGRFTPLAPFLGTFPVGAFADITDDVPELAGWLRNVQNGSELTKALKDSHRAITAAITRQGRKTLGTDDAAYRIDAVILPVTDDDGEPVTDDDGNVIMGTDATLRLQRVA